VINAQYSTHITSHLVRTYNFCLIKTCCPKDSLNPTPLPDNRNQLKETESRVLRSRVVNTADIVSKTLIQEQKYALRFIS